jgi:small subunit ribosomal protein S17
MPKRVLQGVVVSDKTDKTIVVKVERRFTHPVLKKTVRRSKNYHAHDEGNVAKVGQSVQIEESRPFSKTKTWKLVEKAEPGGIVDRVSDAVGGLVDKAKSAVGLS